MAHKSGRSSRWKPRGLFINQAKAQCSIFESGWMAYNCLRHSDRYTLDYKEITPTSIQLGLYDFYVINYHHATLSWLNADSLRQLPGKKFTLVLETLPGDPFVLCPPNVFDAYIALDPTMDKPEDARVYAFPRPLESAPPLAPFQQPEVPVIGTFGFATPGKGFERVVDAVNKEFDRAIVRVNIPSATFCDGATFGLHRTNYAGYLADLCRRVAAPGIQIQVTNDFLSKEQLIRWCAENTLNCFLYHRDQPGLAATTDQAIASGRPLAVSANETFRHIHAYLKPYPFLSLRASIADSVPAVLQMQKDWAPAEFVRKFEGLLADFSLLPAQCKNIRGPLKVAEASTGKKTILVVSHKEHQCGIHQYGVNIVAALAKSFSYRVEHALCSSQEELDSAVRTTNPAAIIYNYYEATMPWLTPAITRSYPMPSLGIMHEVTQEDADAATSEMFDFHLCPDPTLDERNPLVFRTKRLIPHFLSVQPEPPIPVIGSFGFGFGNKGFHKLVLQVQEEYDEAVIRLHMPFNDIVDPQGQYHALETAKHCQAAIKKPGIRLVVNHKFLDKKQLLEFLASNSINAFFYDTGRKRGISSVIEHALAAGRPIAITSSGMFRHILHATPSICIEKSSLKQIHANGIAPLVPFYNEWSEASFIMDYERILNKVLSSGFVRIPLAEFVKDNSPATSLTETQKCDSQPPLDASILESEDLIEQGRYLEARGVLQKILRIDSGHVGALINLSFIENHERNYPEGLRLLSQASALDPHNEIVQGNMAYVKELLEQQELIGSRMLEGKNSDTPNKNASCSAGGVTPVPKQVQSATKNEKGSTFNRILDNKAREDYKAIIEMLFAELPDMMARKIPEANVQQAFVYDTVMKFYPQYSQPKILCVGSFEDTAAALLKKKGITLEEIDPAINCNLDEFTQKRTTLKGTYDIIFSTSVVEHVEDDELFIKQIEKLLAPNGVAIITCDYNDQYVFGDKIPQEDYRFYTQSDLQARLLDGIPSCSLVGIPAWDCPDPDFVYAGCHYTFATLVFQRKNEQLITDESSRKPTRSRRLILVNPATGFSTGMIPLGLASISAYLKQYGSFNNIAFLDANCQDIYADYQSSDIVGITAVTQTIRQATTFARHVKSLQNIPVILGGVHISTYKELPEPFDIGVIGEGEQTMLELMSLPDFSIGNLRDIKGICYRDEGKVVFNGERELLKNLDAIPLPDRGIANMNYYLEPRKLIPNYTGRTLSMLTSRGCPFKCSFCSTSVHWRRFRAFSAERVVEEIETLIDRYNVEIIHLFDDLFIADKKRLMKIHDSIVKKGINHKVKFMCLVRSDMVDDKVMQLLKEMNVVATGIGMESGSNKILKSLKKSTTTVEMNSKLIDLSIKYQIPTMGSFMIGNPGETVSDLIETLKFIVSYRYTPYFTPLTYILTTFPGTELWDYALQNHIPVDDFENVAMDIPSDIKILAKAPLLSPIPLDVFFEISQQFLGETLCKQNISLPA